MRGQTQQRGGIEWIDWSERKNGVCVSEWATSDEETWRQITAKTRFVQQRSTSGGDWQGLSERGIGKPKPSVNSGEEDGEGAEKVFGRKCVVWPVVVSCEVAALWCVS